MSERTANVGESSRFVCTISNTLCGLLRGWLKREIAQVLAMTNLVEAYQKNDITAFERILRTNKYAQIPLPTSIATSTDHACSFSSPTSMHEPCGVCATWVQLLVFEVVGCKPRVQLARVAMSCLGGPRA